MCDPVSIGVATTTLAATQSIMTYKRKRQQAKAQDKLRAANTTEALSAYSGDIEALNLEASVAQEDAAAQRFEQTKEGQLARSGAGTKATARNIGGLSARAIEQALGFQTGENISAINRNAELDSTRHRLQKEGARSTATSRIRSVQPGQKPSPLALVVDLGNAAVKGFSMKQDMTAAQAATGTEG